MHISKNRRVFSEARMPGSILDPLIIVRRHILFLVHELPAVYLLLSSMVDNIMYAMLSVVPSADTAVIL